MGSESVGQDILIAGRVAMNRALDGDIVAVELLPEEQWVRCSQKARPSGLPDILTHPGQATIDCLFVSRVIHASRWGCALELACAGRWAQVRGYAAQRMLSVWQQVRVQRMRSRLRWISWPGIKKELALHPRCSLICAQVLPHYMSKNARS